MRFNSRQAALLGIPDLPLGAFEHSGDRKIRPQGGGIPIVSDIVEGVGDLVGGAVDAVVDVVNEIPVVGDIADDVLGLDPNGGGIVPIVKGVATGVVLSPVGGALGAALNSAAGLGLGAAGQAALGGATMGAATGGLEGAVYGAGGGYIGTKIGESAGGWWNSNQTTSYFDDGSSITYDSSGVPISGTDSYGQPFSVQNGSIVTANGESIIAPQPASVSSVEDAYLDLFGRAPDQAGMDYWRSTGLQGDELRNAILSGASPEDLAAYKVINVPADSYAPVVPEPYNPPPETNWNDVPNIDISGSQTPGTRVQVFDDGTILVTDQSGRVIGNIDTSGNITGPIDITRFDDGSFQITNTDTNAALGGMDNQGGVYGTEQTANGGYRGVYNDGSYTAGTPNINFGGNLADLNTPLTPTDGGSLIPGVPDIVTGLVGGVVVPPLVNPPITNTGGLYAGQTFTPRAPDPRWSRDLVTNDMIPEYIGREASKPFYNTTSPVQSQYYYGVHPFVPLGGDVTQYSQVPEAPAQPWGIQQGYFEQPTQPVAPVIYGQNMTPNRPV